MHALRALAVTFLLMSLAACDMPKPPAAVGTKQITASNSGMEFRGERGCVDCDGIDAWLRLESDNGAQRYRLVEVYYGADHERRFEGAGEWTAQGELLRLHVEGGSDRVYARLADGRLQARGARGQRLPAAEGEVLEPVQFDSTR